MLMGDGARQCLMFFSFQMALACKLRHPHKEGLAFVLVYIMLFHSSSHLCCCVPSLPFTRPA